MYDKLADETLDALAEYFEDLADEGITGSDYDVVFSVSLKTVYLLYYLSSLCQWCANIIRNTLFFLIKSKVPCQVVIINVS